MDRAALHRLKMQADALNFRRWRRSKHVKRIVRAMNLSNPQPPLEKPAASHDEHAKAKADVSKPMLANLGGMQVPKGMEKMLSAQLMKFRSSARLVSDTMKTTYAGVWRLVLDF